MTHSSLGIESEPSRQLADNPTLRTTTCVVCGSFRRDRAGLAREVAALAAADCTILSPVDLDFVRERQGFVYAAHELELAPDAIEAKHLRAMEEADFVWLHAPEGYVGRSAAMELGFAHALGLKVFSSRAPEDVTLSALVQEVPSAHVAASWIQESAGEAPSRSMPALQRYYGRMAERRGWAQEDSTATAALLRGEVEELHDALTAVAAPGASDGDLVALELADVQLYVVHMANILGLDLGTAVAAKERINEERFRASNELADAA